MSDNEDKHDLTRLEDLSEYVHELNSEVDSQLEESSGKSDTPPPPPALDLNELEESAPETPSEFEDETQADINTEELSDFGTDEVEGETFDYTADNLDDATVTDFSEATEPDFQLSSSDISNDEVFSDTDNSDSEFTNIDSDFESSEPISTENNFESTEFEAGQEGDFFTNTDNDESISASETEDEFESTSADDEFEPTSAEDDLENGSETELDDQQNNEQASDRSSEIDDSDTSASTELKSTEAQSSYKAPETFKDVRQFAHNISYGQVTRGGVPPFTLLIKGINFIDDIEDIKIILKEYGLYTDDNKELIDQSLENGTLILPQLSEFTAIFLANKLRRFSGDIQLGLSEEVHPSKGVNKQFKGLVSKENLLRNTRVSKGLTLESVSIDSMIVSTTPTISGQTIQDYLGIVTADVIVPEKFFEDSNIESSDEPSENSEILSTFTIGSSAYYQQLIEQIKIRAVQLKANAVVGLTYTVTPLVNYQDGEKTSSNYKIITTGSAVTLIAAKSNQET